MAITKGFGVFVSNLVTSSSEGRRRKVTTKGGRGLKKNVGVTDGILRINIIFKVVIFYLKEVFCREIRNGDF